MNWKRFYLSVCLVFLLSCDQTLTKETYQLMDANQRRKLSSDYVSLANRTTLGSPQYMQLLEKALRINPKNEVAHMDLSMPYLYSGRYKEWNYHSSKVVKLNPKEWQGWRGYHKLFYFRDYGGALYDLDATDTLTLNKTDMAQNKSVDYLRGLCYLGLKNNEKALEYFNIYIDKENENNDGNRIDIMAYVYKAIIANDQQAYKKALELCAMVNPKKINADTYYQQSIAHFMLGNIQEASTTINKCKSAYKDDNYNKAFTYEPLNQLYLNTIEKLENDIGCFIEH